MKKRTACTGQSANNTSGRTTICRMPSTAIVTNQSNITGGLADTGSITTANAHDLLVGVLATAGVPGAGSGFPRLPKKVALSGPGV